MLFERLSVSGVRALHLAAILALAAGCARAPAGSAARAPAAGAAPADFFPLAVGNEWVYVDTSPSLPPERRVPPRTVRILERTADGYFRDTERGELRAD